MSKWSAGYRDSRYIQATQNAFSLSGGCCEYCGKEAKREDVRILHMQQRLAPWQHDESVMAVFCDDCWLARNYQHYKILIQLLKWERDEVEFVSHMLNRENGILDRVIDESKSSEKRGA